MARTTRDTSNPPVTETEEADGRAAALAKANADARAASQSQAMEAEAEDEARANPNALSGTEGAPHPTLRPDDATRRPQFVRGRPEVPPADTENPGRGYLRGGGGPSISDNMRGDAEAPEVDEETVPMDFPRDVTLLHEGIKHEFKKGIRRVPESMVDHYYLRHNGVRQWEGWRPTRPPAPEEE